MTFKYNITGNDGSIAAKANNNTEVVPENNFQRDVVPELRKEKGDSNAKQYNDINHNSKVQDALELEHVLHINCNDDPKGSSDLPNSKAKFVTIVVVDCEDDLKRRRTRIAVGLQPA